MVRLDLEGKIPEGLSNAEGTLAECEGAFSLTPGPEIFGHKGDDPPEPALIVQGLGKGFGLAQVIEELLVVSQGKERVSEGDPEIDRLLMGLARAPGDVVGR